MAKPKALFKQSDVERAVKGAKKAGFPMGRVEITRDGTIRICSEGAPNDNDNKELPKASSI